MIRQTTTRRTSAALLLSASALAIASVPAQAADVLFSTTGVTEVTPGQRMMHGTGVLQLRLDNGATLSFVDGAEFTLGADGSIDLHKGSVTVAGAAGGETVVRMPEGVEGRVGGTGNAASFTVGEAGESDGHTLTGISTITRGRVTRNFAEGQMWESSGRSGIRRAFARTSQDTPSAAAEPQVAVADLDDGPVAAAENGLPVSLGDGLAAAGASSDVVALGRRLDAANGNPLLDSYPAGDLARLVALAADLEGLNGGTPFPAAQADVIRTYLRYLANGGSGAQFLSAYAGFLTQYLDLVRAGGLPSQFGAASLGDINAFLAYQSRLGRLAELSAQNRALAETYLAFIRSGGNANQFAGTYTDLVEAYFAFVRGGGDPAQFAGASQEVLDAYIAFLGASGLAQQLSATDQQILAAYLDTGGFAFASIYAEALQGYFAYLAGGGLPSASTTLTPAQLEAYLDLLDRSGLFAQLLGDQAGFYAAYLAHLRQGGAPDAFGQLNANVFAAYAGQLNAYFAFLQGGGLPSNFTGDPALLAQYLAALDDADALEAFLGGNAGFFAQYLAFLQGGGNIDLWNGLNANVFAGYASALDAYYTYLAQGGLPSQYGALTQEQIAAYVAALQAQGATSAFLAGLAGFYTDYLAYLSSGGNPDVYTGLPVLNLPAFADALNAYAAFLAAGGLPSDYDGAGLNLLAIYLDAIGRSGDLAALLGANADLLDAYFAFFATGGNADQFAGLPIYADYVSALQAYFAFLDAGGLPANYTALTPAQVQSYLAALSAAGGFGTQLGGLADFYTAYFAYLATGGAPNGFSGLPVYADYVSALNAYYAFLAGGGLPGDYTALTPQQVADYLAALNGAGGFAAYGSLNGFFSQYFAFISGGGDPAEFSGLPVYADYVSALNAYFAFLANGGLPGDYTALTPQQIEDYLAALNAAGGFAAYGSLNTFFAQYYAFLQGGGDPGDFAGLPVYADYLAALQAYYAYLANGGLPSGYTALTQEQIEAYIAALDAVGVLQAQLSGEQLQFVLDYLAYLQGGGDPDQFAGLPDGTDNQLAGLNSYVFGTGALFANTAADADIDDDGRITRVMHNSTAGNQTFDYTARDADLREHGRIGNDVAWTRYYVGAASGATNVSEHLLVGAKPTALPASGTVQYDLVGGTAPTDRRDVAGSTAYFTGELGVAFGTTPLVGVNFDVLSGTEGYRVSTTGGAANPASGGMGVTAAGTFENQSLAITDLTATTCAGFCQAQVFGSLFGAGGASAGFTYNVFDQTANNAIQGVAVFGTSGTPLTGLGTEPVPVDPVFNTVAAPVSLAYAGGFNPATAAVNFQTGLFIAGSGYFPSSEAGFNTSAYSLNGSGGLTSYTRDGSITRTSGTTTIAEPSGNADALIGRWTDGANTGGNPVTMTANQGLHYVLTRPVAAGFVLPTQGLISYELLAATRPTILDGSLPAGGFEADLAVVLGATPRVAFEATITMPGTDGGPNVVRSYASLGGMANPTQSASTLSMPSGGSAGFFSFQADGIPGADCTQGSCIFNASGNFAGDSDTLAFIYRASGNGGNDKVIVGSALFGNGTLTGGVVNNPTATADGVAPTSATGRYIAYSGAGGSNVGPVSGVTVTNGEFITSPVGASGVLVSYTKNANSVTESDGDQGVIGWQRSENVATTYRDSSGQARNANPFANQSWHTLWGTPLVNLPASGLINYDLIGSTKATQTNAQGGFGTFDGQLAIDFATLKVGLDASVVFGATTYAFASAGGVAAPSMNLNSDAQQGRRFSGSLATTGNGSNVSRGTFVEGFVSGDGASHAGLTYAIGVSSSNKIQGAAAFRAEGYTPPPPGNPPGTLVLTDQILSNTGTSNYLDVTAMGANVGTSGYATDAAGEINLLKRQFGGLQEDAIGTATNADSAMTASGNVRWTRWTGGAPDPNYQASVPSLSANQGYHILVGSALTNMPSSGTVTYALAGGTRPTSVAGTGAPGTLVSASAAIAFGATNRLGVDLAFTQNGSNYTLSTIGGSANPGISDLAINSEGNFRLIGTYGQGVQIGGINCASCRPIWEGFLAGNGGTEMAMTYEMQVQNGDRIIGAAAFVAGAQSQNLNPYASAPGGGFTTQSTGAATAQPAEWDRWAVAPGDISTGNGMGQGAAMIAPGMERLAASGIQFSAEQLARLEAHIISQGRAN